jgi:hypothetical protein
MNKELNIGFTACYIHDYKDKYITEIPFEAAATWAKAVVPDISSHAILRKTFDNISEPDDWLNKLFVIVGMEHDKWICLYNHDGKFSIRTIDYIFNGKMT